MSDCPRLKTRDRDKRKGPATEIKHRWITWLRTEDRLIRHSLNTWEKSGHLEDKLIIIPNLWPF